MTGNAINAKNEALELRDEDLDAVSGGCVYSFPRKQGTGGGQNDPAQMFQQILQQLTQGG